MIKLRKHFPGQRRDETTVILSRVHWFKFMGHLFFVLTLILVWLISYILIDAYLPELLEEAWRNLFILISSAYFLFVILFAYVGWLNYYLDIWLVTNQRLIDIDQRALFSRHVSQLNLRKIQNVKVDVDGIIPTFLQFGDVDVESAGAEAGRFSFRSIPHPYRMERKILALARIASKRLRTQRREEETEDGPEIIHAKTWLKNEKDPE